MTRRGSFGELMSTYQIRNRITSTCLTIIQRSYKASYFIRPHHPCLTEVQIIVNSLLSTKLNLISNSICATQKHQHQMVIIHYSGTFSKVIPTMTLQSASHCTHISLNEARSIFVCFGFGTWLFLKLTFQPFSINQKVI